MESTECIAAHAIAAWSLSTSAAYVRATLSRANASTPAGVSRRSAVVVMGLLNQQPPTVSSARIRLCARDLGLYEVVRRGLDTLADARYSTTETAPYSTTGTSAVLGQPGRGRTYAVEISPVSNPPRAIRWSSR